MLKDYKEEQKNLTRMFLAVLISMTFVTTWNFLFPNNTQEASRSLHTTDKTIVPPKEEEVEDLSKKEKFTTTYLENDNIKIGFDYGSNLKITYAKLKKHRKDSKQITSDDQDYNINILSKDNFIAFGCLVKNNQTQKWTLVSKDKNNLIFRSEENNVTSEVIFSLDENNIISVSQAVKNNNKDDIEISFYGKNYRIQDKKSTARAYEGILLYSDNKLQEIDYSKLNKNTIKKNNFSWAGFSDQYWLTALINNKSQNLNFSAINKETAYQFHFHEDYITLKPYGTHSLDSLVFIGPKDFDLLNSYSNKYLIKSFDKAIDFGVFYFIGKPLLILLKKLYGLFGNFGVAIIIMTLIIRIAMLPLSNKSYKSMAKMKEFSPKIKAIQDSYKDNKQEMQRQIVRLYKEHNINPFASFVPMLIQIPIFFALYKVLIISIEMRDAPFFGWIKDLSEPDPTSIFNLFGLLNYNTPEFLNIGVLPIIMGITMIIQQKITPMQTTSIDKTQENIIKMMPIIFTFMFASFPSGLILYWIVSNIFTILNQSFFNRKITIR
jgi:YidC/Oxa1 family membrane protein insertase